MIMTRPAAVAGSFYPGDAKTLAATVDQLLADASTEQGFHPKALIVPHAGYVYSGATAARAYAMLAPRASEIRRVVLLGPTHRVAVTGLALPEAEAFATPLGTVRLDAQAI
ncbi:MAG TPA: AmmeMemoRadiSam system protein B, partial [Azonexus sp.]|nr:AmmeMemoRadiSam system protein B [Azonexus sp.]